MVAEIDLSRAVLVTAGVRKVTITFADQAAAAGELLRALPVQVVTDEAPASARRDDVPAPDIEPGYWRKLLAQARPAVVDEAAGLPPECVDEVERNKGSSEDRQPVAAMADVIMKAIDRRAATVSLTTTTERNIPTRGQLGAYSTECLQALPANYRKRSNSAGFRGAPRVTRATMGRVFMP
ncbi:MAG TPA: hypothetical protein VKE40_22175 [Gemmataceae bacterium]|nr:hypothetical protein [Gemmataceae bacterium]